MKSTTEIFGKYENQDVHLFTMENDNGVTLKLMDFGATVTSVTIPDAKGNPISIACGFNNFDDYLSEAYKANAPYFGCTVGRYCSQIKNARYSLDGNDYLLVNNCGDNNLHGGAVGFDKKMWKAKAIEGDNKTGVEFSLISHNMEEGFPGTVNVIVTIELNNDNEIIINYKGVSDKDTPLSMTNHSYFNLSGFKNTVESHHVKVYTDERLEADETGACTGGIIDVTGTIEDLRNGQVIKKVHDEIGDGFEHFYIFDNKDEKLQKVAEVSELDFGRSLTVYSTEPCMLFYTGKYTSDNLMRHENEKYGKYRGFACETHRWPNGPNIEGSPKSITKSNETYKSTTVYKLNW
ncbi:galactose mutarotase [Labilibacter sediminis]|nr:galactose mutarotase [Labilibacter sediminis]